MQVRPEEAADRAAIRAVHAAARLADAQQVHRDLAARKTTGATVMIP